MNIANDCVVAFHYTLTDDNGVELDSSKGQDPLAYLHGHGGIIPGLERELEGKVAGDELKVTVQPGDAYGELNPELIQAVPRDAFQGVEQIEVGMQFQAQGDDHAPNDHAENDPPAAEPIEDGSNVVAVDFKRKK